MSKTKVFLFINNYTYIIKKVNTYSKKRAIEINSQLGNDDFEYISKKDYLYFLELNK